MDISYYQSLASGVWLFEHQIAYPLLKLINLFFRKIGWFRSRFFLFGLAFDKKLYSLFRQKIYERQQHQARKTAITVPP